MPILLLIYALDRTVRVTAYAIVATQEKYPATLNEENETNRIREKKRA